MDPVLEEENENLDRIENTLDQIIRPHVDRRNELQRSLTGFISYDYEDRQRFQELQRDLNNEEAKISKYESYKPSPYFARMDLETEVDGSDKIEAITVFVGKEGIQDNGKELVIDWRSKVGEYYYAKNDRNFEVGDYMYQLVLRRALTIENEKLKSYFTEFDASNVTLEGDIVDEFLLTVLKDKRRHNRLTDIIRSIQENQNSIIRRPEDESFVVQGCAGSGKTMILLHRLSYILFNNRSLVPSSMKIITPNKFFDAHIDELSHELGLDQIQRYTVEEYYVELIHQFSGKISVDSVVTSEKGLDETLLRSIYSSEFATRLTARYHEYWEDISNSLNQLRLPQIFEQSDKKYPDFTVHRLATHDAAVNSIDEIIKVYDKYQLNYRKALERFKSIQAQIDLANSRLNQAESQIQSAHDTALIALQVESRSCDKSRSELQQQATDLKEKIKTSADEVKQIKLKRDQLNELQEMLTQNRFSYLDISKPISAGDNIAKNIAESTSEIRKQYQLAKTELETVASYNFGRRNTLRRQISELETYYSENAKKILDSTRTDIEEKLMEADEQITALENFQRDLGVKEQQIKTSQQNISIRDSAAKSCIEKFELVEYPNLEVLLSKQDYTVVLPLVNQYVTAYSSYRKEQRLLDRLEASLKSCKEKLVENSETLTEEDYAALKKSRKLIDKLEFSAISRNVMFKALLAEYHAFKQTYQKDNYRHKLYLRLLLCTLYFTNRQSSRLFVSIDEAQDIDVQEYSLLRYVLSPQCVFNLYGDVNQLVYSYKGISNWGDIDFITEGHEYILNENYRNTMQITEYCNKEFEADIYPIGISGRAVEECSLIDAVHAILDIKQTNPSARTAIIYRYGRSKILERVERLLPPEQASLDAVDDEKISVITIESAKGLEFDAVAVITDSLNYNEKYIAFTRALDCLFVVNDNFPSEEIISNGKDEIEDDFIEEDKPDHELGDTFGPDVVNIE